MTSDTIRSRHVPVWEPTQLCADCRDDWPCDAIREADRADAARAALAEMTNNYEAAVASLPIARALRRGDDAADVVMGMLHEMRTYARHQPFCGYRPSYPEGSVATCDCGFDALLDAYDRLAAS